MATGSKNYRKFGREVAMLKYCRSSHLFRWAESQQEGPATAEHKVRMRQVCFQGRIWPFISAASVLAQIIRQQATIKVDKT
jgi:hypothetical protein